MRYIALAMLITLGCIPAFAQKTIADGNSLDESCRYERQRENGAKLTNDEEFGKAMFCIGYVRGVLDEIWMQQTLPDQLGIKNLERSKICMPDEISNSQALKVVLKYLADNPAKLQFSGNYLIRLSIQESFPCKAIH